MGSDQSSQPAHKAPASRAPPIRRGHTISAPARPDTSRNFEPSASGNDSPGASLCSDTELPYISYTVDRPIGDSPKASKTRPEPRKPARRQMSLQTQRHKRAHDIVVVKQPANNQAIDVDIQRLQDIPTFLPIMRSTLGLPAAPHTEAAVDAGAVPRLLCRLQAHLAACAHALSGDQAPVPVALREIDSDIARLHALFVDRQRANARNAERLSRVREMSNQLSRCHSLLNQTLHDVDELNNLLPVNKRLDPFVWKT